jgi:hypothetical protein
VGDARSDPAFGPGRDTVQYDVPVPAGAGYRISAELLYESIGYRWAHNLDDYQADEPQRFRSYFARAAAHAVKKVASVQIQSP